MAFTRISARLRPLLEFVYRPLTAGVDGIVSALIDSQVELSTTLITDCHAYSYDPLTAGDNIKSYTWDGTDKLRFEGVPAINPDGTASAMTKLYAFAISIRRRDRNVVPSGTITVTRTDWDGVTGSRVYTDDATILGGTAGSPFTLLSSSVLTLTASAAGCGLVADIIILGGTA